MNKILWIVFFGITFSMGQLQNVWATPAFVEKNIKIIDIRTPNEWEDTGIVKGSYTIMFFDEKGAFDLKKFLRKIDKIVKKDEQFALLCRIGSRTGTVANFLSYKLHYNVINLKGGITKMIKEGYKTTPYP